MDRTKGAPLAEGRANHTYHSLRCAARLARSRLSLGVTPILALLSYSWMAVGGLGSHIRSLPKTVPFPV